MCRFDRHQSTAEVCPNWGEHRPANDYSQHHAPELRVCETHLGDSAVNRGLSSDKTHVGAVLIKATKIDSKQYKGYGSRAWILTVLSSSCGCSLTSCISSTHACLAFLCSRIISEIWKTENTELRNPIQRHSRKWTSHTGNWQRRNDGALSRQYSLAEGCKHCFQGIMLIVWDPKQYGVWILYISSPLCPKRTIVINASIATGECVIFRRTVSATQQPDGSYQCNQVIQRFVIKS